MGRRPGGQTLKKRQCERCDRWFSTYSKIAKVCSKCVKGYARSTEVLDNENK